MQKRQLMLGWGLILIWALVLSAMVVNYHKTEAKMLKIELLGDSIEEFRSRLFFDAPYRVNLVDQQVSNLENIEALHDELVQGADTDWFSPDIQQLLFTTEWFVEQSRAFVDTELALVALIGQIQEKRLAYVDQPDIVVYYYRLSAYVFEALFSSKSQASVAYRDLDNLYTQSLSLADTDKQQLQVVLANTSQVMGSYAQGSYLVAQLVSHSVHAEVTAIGEQYHRLLAQHLLVGALFSGGAMLLLMVLWYRSGVLLTTRLSSSAKQTTATQPQVETSGDASQIVTENVSATPSSHSEEIQAPIVAETLASEPSLVEQEINFPLMLDSLGDDRESLCMLLEVFIDDHQNDVAAISRLLNDAPDEAIRKAHSLKGVGGNLGADRLRDIAGKVEEALQNDSPQVPKLLMVLDTHLSKAIAEAREFLAQSA
ncbi:signal transduction histidine kinase [Vibrio ichthyoenteri ATCC 700023]|uniref:Signal transduction histidine kinase n=1 Tax=Vibrio ichthyoenteri ATCC 700023 TaxID=870968 RepID=F9S1N2_9VIBR|nr:Hpt domain-containing protein [Vibrio ichthyoenteri]EGU41595.1 signal transduction histidine kinase [Vibrio ichthyoenteri ATCC 700023]